MGQAKAPTTLAEQRVSQRLAALLDARGMSGAELARRCDWTQSYVARRLRNEVPWRVDDLKQIANVLTVDPGELIP